ncbi:hypothetical protein ABL78_4936 [Leptomonas seymouri]|uniref:Uncharacterized protein n=1 Tax=Leptomonas seymouri TaxID=5684 RepID=A0A0N1HXJ4_LEPSE|nr:hypothetical protein ABL78_4936 [Leptomonas seymouri]|eukprot:KPI86003.1 hypothetical protein ABL78_4936 [Leptomonas seymouri]
MDRFAQYGGRGASLHRDAGDSQSLSQTRPRPAIRLDASLSFLHPDSSVGSPCSGPASPALAPAQAFSAFNPPPTMFMTRDVNVEGSHPGSHGSLKPRGNYRREISGSLPVTSVSLSLGSSRPCSQSRRPPPHSHQQRQAETEDEVESGKLYSHNAARSFPSLAVTDAALESEATVMTRPSELLVDGGNRAGEEKEGEEGSLMSQRAVSPAPRMAVTLPDDFGGEFSEARRAVTAVGASCADNGAQARGLSVCDAPTVMPGKADIFSNASSCSFSLKGSASALARDNDGEGSCRSCSGRTCSTTPPPRRAFVLSQRRSAASAATGEGERERAARDSNDADAEVEAPQGVLAPMVHGSAAPDGDVVADITAGAVATTTMRGSEVLVMDSSEDARSFFGQMQRGGRGRRRHGQLRCSVEGEAEEERIEADDADDVRSRGERADAPPALPVGRLVPGQAGEGGRGDVEIGLAPEGDGKDQPDATAESFPLLAARESTGLRLSDCVSGSSRSSMMSPLPRPVPSYARSAAGAARKSPRISPAHPRGDKEEEEEHVGAGDEKEEVMSEVNACMAPTDGDEDIPERGDGDSMGGAVVGSVTGEARDGEAVARAAMEPHPVSQAENSNGESEEGKRGVAPLDSIFEEHAEPSSSTTRTTADAARTTVATATSSLWLVSGPTPTPLRRLRGDYDKSPEDETETAEVQLDAFKTLEAEPEEEASESAQRNRDEPAMVETALPITLHDAAPPQTTSPLRSAAVSVTSETGEAPKAAKRSAPSTPNKQRVGDVPDAQAPHQPSSPPGACGNSCSPEPQRPEAPHLQKATATAIALNASISPVPSLDRHARHHHLRVQEVGTVPDAVPAPHTSIPATTAAQRAMLQMEFDLMKPSMPTSTTPLRPSRQGDSARASAGAGGATPHRTMSAHANTTVAASATMSPSTALSESARVSEEVRELVERAQAEVRRTRASLLATLRDRRADFRLSEVSPTPKAEQPDTSLSVTPTRSLVLLPVTNMSTTTTATHTSAGVPPSTPTHEAGRAGRTSGEQRAAAVTLRPQLAEAADAILRRLQGYDTRDHGVLPMETVIRVTYFVVTRRRMPVATWTLRTADGGIASTPMRASMAEHGRGGVPSAHQRAMDAAVSAASRNSDGGGRADVLAGTPHDYLMLGRKGSTGSTVTACASPSNQHRIEGGAHMKCSTPSLMKTPSLAGSSFGMKRTRSEEGAEAEAQGRPATLMSPGRTLEQVMAHQERRAEEERYLSFYFTVLEAFKQVFGERYAWHHLGATNASRHDNVAAKRAKQDRTTPKGMQIKNSNNTIAEVEKDESDTSAHLSIENELNDIVAPLETVFPRLRQRYALRQEDLKRSPGTGFAQRPPPLDVLVYYRTYTDSLREL